jgi:hypothetical protein
MVFSKTQMAMIVIAIITWSQVLLFCLFFFSSSSFEL